ncbi:MAG: PHP domain-containing protein [Candidatus Omnitrophica bacterium]|nr:PHP domain-containing protein [Candidatus Omnitrophota bacterium]MDD5653083.1 PHP domain-containing protein [Candidatus Omnitrophota bacterium]
MRYADLHLHTTYSDSTYTPSQLIQEAHRVGLSTIAVVDHDTVGGIIPAVEAAKAVDLEVVPGIELTAEQDNQEVHVLGYCLDYRNSALLKQLASLKENRIQRIYKITEKLKNIGIDLNAESVFEISGGGTVGRLHVARAMLKEKIVSSIFEAFHKYIGDKCPAYVLGFRLSVQQAIGLIKSAGGIPVLAHPYSVHNDSLILDYIKAGIMGLEVYYPEHTQSMRNYYLNLTKEYHLVATGGSDCHGKAKPEVRIGSIKIPYELVEKLKEAKC